MAHPFNYDRVILPIVSFVVIFLLYLAFAAISENRSQESQVQQFKICIEAGLNWTEGNCTK